MASNSALSDPKGSSLCQEVGPSSSSSMASPSSCSLPSSAPLALASVLPPSGALRVDWTACSRGDCAEEKGCLELITLCSSISCAQGWSWPWRARTLRRCSSAAAHCSSSGTGCSAASVSVNGSVGASSSATASPTRDELALARGTTARSPLGLKAGELASHATSINPSRCSDGEDNQPP